MKKIEYLSKILNTGIEDDPVWLTRVWYILMFSILLPNDDSDVTIPYMGKMTDKGFLFLNDKGDMELLEGTVSGKPIFDKDDMYTVGDLYKHLINKDTPEKSSLGNIIANILLVGYSFKFIPFQYGKWSISSLESDYISIGMMKDGKEKDHITVAQYKKYMEAAKFLSELSNLFVISSTEKSITSAPGIAKIRDKLLEENKDKLDDYTVIAGIENELRNADNEYMEGDPTNNIFIGGKVKNVARKRMYSTYGAEEDYSNPGKAVYIKESLEEGIPADPEKLVAAFNGVRMGSYLRGAETQKGGVAAKDLLRTLNSFTIVDGDCGTTRTVKYVISKSNTNVLTGLNIVVTGKVVRLDKRVIEKYDGKIVDLRTPLYCLEEGNHFCEVCGGERLNSKENEIAIASMETSHVMLTASLKAMHGTVLSTVDIDMIELSS